MVRKLKRKVFWIAELLPLGVLVLVLIVYNFFYISFNFLDEKATLDYCASCVEKHTDIVDRYLPLPVEDLVAASKQRVKSDRSMMNLLYAIISSDVGVMKLDADMDVMGEIGNTAGADPSLCRKGKGRLGNMLYSVVKKEGVTYIIFLNTGKWNAAIWKSIVLAVLGLITAAILLGAVASRLSNRVARPVEEALVQQNRFIADTCHELKTPISVINANMSVLEHEYGKSKWVDYIKAEGHSMNRLINQLLSLCRLDHDMNEAVQFTATKETFPVFESIMECALPFDSIAFEKKACILTDCPAELMSRGNIDDFKRIISTLLDNAITHVDEGGLITIEVKSGAKPFLSSGKSSILVTVSNTGSVIEEADLPFIFDRFYKARSGREAEDGDDHCPAESNGCKGENFGLGLSIAKALADKNSFEINVSSADNRTSFIVSIPCVQVNQKKRK